MGVNSALLDPSALDDSIIRLGVRAVMRIYIPLSQIAGFDYDDSYRTIAWLCWVPNLLVAHLLVRSARVQADF
jgi:hypothetical protein